MAAWQECCQSGPQLLLPATAAWCCLSYSMLPMFQVRRCAPQTHDCSFISQYSAFPCQLSCSCSRFVPAKSYENLKLAFRSVTANIAHWLECEVICIRSAAEFLCAVCSTDSKHDHMHVGSPHGSGVGTVAAWSKASWSRKAQQSSLQKTRTSQDLTMWVLTSRIADFGFTCLSVPGAILLKLHVALAARKMPVHDGARVGGELARCRGEHRHATGHRRRDVRQGCCLATCGLCHAYCVRHTAPQNAAFGDLVQLGDGADSTQRYPWYGKSDSG